MNTPVNRLEALIHIPLVKKINKSTSNDRLIPWAHGQIGIFPLPQHAQALEVFPVNVNVLCSVFPAFLADFSRLHGRLFPAQLLINFEFDRQAMTVPSRDKRSVKSRHALGLD